MKDEVEEFLRRVAQLRAQAEAQTRAQQSRPGMQPPQQRVAQPARLVPAQEEVVYLEPADAEVIDAEVAELNEDSGRYAPHHIRGEYAFAAHARELGAEVDLADDKLENRLHETFDHQLGRLKKTATDSAAIEHVKPATDVTIAEIKALLATPAKMRDAIVMAEILRRPVDRW
jgi:hypothetical protein